MKSCCSLDPEPRPWWRKKRNWLSLILMAGLAGALVLQAFGLV